VLAESVLLAIGGGTIMSNFKNITNQRFGRLVAIEENGKASDGHIKWLSKCDCGNALNVIGKDLRRGHRE
jgi:hypothetical protein